MTKPSVEGRWVEATRNLNWSQGTLGFSVSPVPSRLLVQLIATLVLLVTVSLSRKREGGCHQRHCAWH